VDRQCSSCGGFCKKSRCERENTKPNTKLKREWVGLTGEEIGTLTVFDGLHHVETPLLADFIRAIQAKLKEKNT